MSYILDALRRAEAERAREQQAVPGLLSAPLGTKLSHAAGQPRRTWLAAAAALLLAGGIGLGAWLGRSQPAQPLMSVPPPAPVSIQAPAHVPVPATSTESPSSEAAAQSAAQATDALAASPVEQRQFKQPPRSAPRPTPPAAMVNSTQPAVPADGEPPSADQLPIGQRRELPKFAINGSVYSEDRSSRFLIVNGEVMHEGATLAPGLLLEQIRPHELLLNYRGLRYRQPL